MAKKRPIIPKQVKVLEREAKAKAEKKK